MSVWPDRAFLSPERDVICITGGIGSGKSVVSRILRSKGFPVYDTDSRAKILMSASEPLRAKVAELLGARAFSSSGRLERDYIASIIFRDRRIRESLNGEVHKAVKADFESWCVRQKGVTVFMECAIPATSGMTRYCTAYWLVEAPEKIRVRRVMLRSSLSRADIEGRIKSQLGEFSVLPEEDTRIIINDGVSALLPQIDRLLDDSCKYSLNGGQDFEIKQPQT